MRSEIVSREVLNNLFNADISFLSKADQKRTRRILRDIKRFMKKHDFNGKKNGRIPGDTCNNLRELNLLQ